MLRSNRIFTLLVLVALIFSACQPITRPPAATPQPPQGLRPDAPPYAVHGPYAVGVRDFTVQGAKPGDRPLMVSVWYPAQNPENKPEAVTYTLGFPTSANPDFTIAGHALINAPPDLSGGPYPLVVHSHGGWSFRQDVAYLAEHLASHGFVFMAPLHADNWGILFENFYKSEISRPRDMTRVIDFAEKLTVNGGALAGLIDAKKVAVSGWSLGGQIAMEMAGARLNLVEQQKGYCVAYPDDQRCKFYVDRIDEMAKLAGLTATPQDAWPDWSDPRVTVILPFEPSEGSLGALPVTVRVPVLLLEGTVDKPGYGFNGIASEHKTGIIFENADHFIFMNNCTAQPGMAQAGYASVCSDSVWDMDRAHDLINHFVTAFLLAELKGDKEAAKALAPANVAFTGIKYETTEFNK